jgi:hypothetical protein
MATNQKVKKNGWKKACYKICQLRKKPLSRRLLRCKVVILYGGPGSTTTCYEASKFLYLVCPINVRP